jgi:hypothetical protein
VPASFPVTAYSLTKAWKIANLMTTCHIY